jgi:hypothetical protein
MKMEGVLKKIEEKAGDSREILEEGLLKLKNKQDAVIYEEFDNSVEENNPLEEKWRQEDIKIKASELINLGIPANNMFHGKPLADFLAEHCYEEIVQIYNQTQINYSEENKEDLKKGVLSRTIPIFFSERIMEYRSFGYPLIEHDEGEQFLYNRITPSLAKYILKTFNRTDGLEYYSKYTIPKNLHHMFNKCDTLQENYSEEIAEIITDYIGGLSGSMNLNIYQLEDFLNSGFAKERFNSDFLKDAIKNFTQFNSNEIKLLAYLGSPLYETKWGKKNMVNMDDFKNYSLQRYLVEFMNHPDVDGGEYIGEDFLQSDFNDFLSNNHTKEYINNERLERVFKFMSRHIKYLDDTFGDASNALFDLCVRSEDDYEKVIHFFEKNIKDNHSDLKSLKVFKEFNINQNIKDILYFSLHQSKQNIVKIARFVTEAKVFEVENENEIISQIVIPSAMSALDLEHWLKKDVEEKTELEKRYEMFMDHANPIDIKNLGRLKHAIQSISTLEENKKMSDEGRHALDIITKIIIDTGVMWAEKKSNKAIVDKIKEEYNTDNFKEEMITDEFIQAYIMANKAEKNSSQSKELIDQYILGNTFPYKKEIFKSYPFNEKSNEDFLEGEYSYGGEFFSIKNIRNWYNPNEKVYSVESDEINSEEVRRKKYEHHLKIANNYLKKLELEECNSNEVLVGRKAEMYELRKKVIKNTEGYLNYIDDIITQIDAIIYLSKRTISKKTISSVKIYHELNPIKVTMMGNWVEGSCLAFDNATENYYSAFTNALDVNKAVFYIEDERGNIIGRVLTAITNSGELLRFPLYTKGAPNIDLDKYFNQYIKELAKKCKLTLTKNSNSKEDVELLISEEWYDEDSLQSFD